MSQLIGRAGVLGSLWNLGILWSFDILRVAGILRHYWCSLECCHTSGHLRLVGVVDILFHIGLRWHIGIVHHAPMSAPRAWRCRRRWRLFRTCLCRRICTDECLRIHRLADEVCSTSSASILTAGMAAVASTPCLAWTKELKGAPAEPRCSCIMKSVATWHGLVGYFQTPNYYRCFLEPNYS